MNAAFLFVPRSKDMASFLRVVLIDLDFFAVSNGVPGFSLNHRLQMARTYHKSRMESISLFSTSTALEGLELFNPLPDPLDGESDFLHEYNDDVYSCIEERKAPLSNLLAEDLLQELNFEGLYYYFLVLR